MATSTVTGIGEVERRQLAVTGGRALVTSALILAAYSLVPLGHRGDHAVGLRLGAGLALFVAVLVVEIRAITRNRHPMLRAGVAMATVLPLFLVFFAWMYLTMSNSDPRTFHLGMDRMTALYFTCLLYTSDAADE